MNEKKKKTKLIQVKRLCIFFLASNFGLFMPWNNRIRMYTKTIKRAMWVNAFHYQCCSIGTDSVQMNWWQTSIRHYSSATTPFLFELNGMPCAACCFSTMKCECIAMHFQQQSAPTVPFELLFWTGRIPIEWSATHGECVVYTVVNGSKTMY